MSFDFADQQEIGNLDELWVIRLVDNSRHVNPKVRVYAGEGICV